MGNDEREAGTTIKGLGFREITPKNGESNIEWNFAHAMIPGLLIMV